jgi:hypothetical protein
VGGGSTSSLSRSLAQLEEVVTDDSDSALAKHRAWLREVAKQREALLKASEEASRKEEERKRRIADAQKAFRDMVRSQPTPEPGAAPPSGVSPRAARSVSPRPAAGASTSPRAGGDATAVLRLGVKGGGVGGSGGAGASAPLSPQPPPAAVTAASKRPAWARTEKLAAAVEADEATALVDFAHKLDYDRCVRGPRLAGGGGEGGGRGLQRRSSCRLRCGRCLRGVFDCAAGACDECDRVVSAACAACPTALRAPPA